MPMRPCLKCGALSSESYCPEHRRLPFATAKKDTHSRRMRNTYEYRTNRKRALIRDGYVCRYCGHDVATEVDHVVPLDQGGDNSLDNLASICIPCHRRKTKAER